MTAPVITPEQQADLTRVAREYLKARPKQDDSWITSFHDLLCTMRSLLKDSHENRPSFVVDGYCFHLTLKGLSVTQVQFLEGTPVYQEPLPCPH